VIVTMTPEADVVDARFCRSIIHSKAALAYSQVM
jgi:exoribonuclease R